MITSNFFYHENKLIHKHMTLTLVTPHLGLMDSYLEALDEGKFINMQLGHGDIPKEQIVADPQAYIALISSSETFTYLLGGKPFQITDHERLWITDGFRFLGTVALRYAGDKELMEEFAGHLGMAIRPSLLNKGFGPRTLNAVWDDLIVKFRAKSVPVLYATCNVDNRASARLMEYIGFIFVRRQENVHGMGPNLLFRFEIP